MMLTPDLIRIATENMLNAMRGRLEALPEHIEAHRFGRTKSLWYVLHPGGNHHPPHGAFGDWRIGKHWPVTVAGCADCAADQNNEHVAGEGGRCVGSGAGLSRQMLGGE